MQPVGEQLLLHQLAIKFKLQLRDAERRQLRRQQAKNVVTLLEAVDLLRYCRRLAYQAAKGFHRGVFLRHGFRFP